MGAIVGFALTVLVLSLWDRNGAPSKPPEPGDTAPSDRVVKAAAEPTDAGVVANPKFQFLQPNQVQMRNQFRPINGVGAPPMAPIQPVEPAP